MAIPGVRGRSRRPSGRPSPASCKARWGRSPLGSNPQRITRASQVSTVLAKAWVLRARAFHRSRNMPFNRSSCTGSGHPPPLPEPDAPPRAPSGPDDGAGRPASTPPRAWAPRADAPTFPSVARPDRRGEPPVDRQAGHRGSQPPLSGPACAGGSAPPPSARPHPPKIQSPTPPQSERRDPDSHIPHAGPPRPPRRPDLQPPEAFFDKRPESIHLDLTPMPVVDPDLGEGLGVSGRRPPPPPDGLHRVAGDRFGGAPAPPAHPHPQGARHFRRGGA
jgi:hypothetical protein